MEVKTPGDGEEGTVRTCIPKTSAIKLTTPVLKNSGIGVQRAMVHVYWISVFKSCMPR